MMAKAKMMNESAFEKLTKEFGALGELIRARQDEKQAILNEFDKERDRYKKGKISENTLASSVRKTNTELIRLDKNIRDIIQKALKISGNMNDSLRKQQPKVFRAKESGFVLQGSPKKKKVVKRKTVKKKSVKKKVVKKKAPSKKSKISKAEIAREMKAEKKYVK